jgi:cytochrome c peroxidase
MLTSVVCLKPPRLSVYFLETKSTGLFAFMSEPRRVEIVSMKQILLILVAFGLLACSTREERTQALARRAGAVALVKVAAPPPARVELGRMLFFDPILSGNRDVSCATCHHPDFVTGDGRALPIGVGGTGLGPDRVMGKSKEVVARNSPDLFNRSQPEIHTMFWDMRIEAGPDHAIISPAGGLLPKGARTMFAAQAMFPVIARQEMRGERGEEGNEIGALFDSQATEIWAGLMARLMEIEEYRRLFKAAFPAIPVESMTFREVALALADFQSSAFDLVDTPWDEFMRLEPHSFWDVMTLQHRPIPEDALAGAALFFGEAGCANCHSGAMLTDQKPHNIAVPQLGPGKAPFKPYDVGFQAVSGSPKDAFKFRTPPLRNVFFTGPYMHNGAFATVGEAIRHHVDPEKSWDTWDTSHLPDDLRSTIRRDEETRRKVFATAESAKPSQELTDQNIRNLEAFLQMLTDRDLKKLANLTLESVSSGLAVDHGASASH